MRGAWFIRQRLHRTDCHLVREVVHDDRDPAFWRPQLERYFAPLDADETRESDARRGVAHSQQHSRAASGMMENLGHWSRELRGRDATLSVYNPRSVLAGVLPVYPR